MPSHLPQKVKIVEVGPRDGLQNEPQNIPTSIKLAFISKLVGAGLKTIEATSFVSPKWVPQMSDHAEVLRALKKDSNIHYPVLVPNEEGLLSAIDEGVKDIAIFTAASETFSKKNTNCSIEESFSRIEKIIKIAKEHQLNIRGYISCVLGCPYEGNVSPQKVSDIAERLLSIGCHEISLGDTIGVGTPLKAQQLINLVAAKIPMNLLAVHFHDTYGQALANVFACLELGVSIIDASVSGLGGCPYAPGAKGNIATENVIFMLNGMGIETGVDIDKLREAGSFIRQYF